MIAKASTGSDFGGVLRYVLGKDKKAEVLHTQHLYSRPDQAARIMAEMRDCAAQNGRCKKPVYHLSLSWPEEDAPSASQMVATARRFLQDLGLGEHHALVVRHRDTAHEHVHIVVNRVHVDTLKAWSPGLNRLRLPPICRAVEREMGWRVVPSRRRSDRARPTAKEQTAERKRGVEPLAKAIRRKCWNRLAYARTWEDVESALNAGGYTLAVGGRRGGLVITDGKRQTSASRVHRGLSRPKLERRFEMSLEDHRAAAERIRKRVALAWDRGRGDDMGL